MSFQDESDSRKFLPGSGLFDPPPAAPTAMSLQVNKDNVLQAAVIVGNAVDHATVALTDLARVMVVRPSGDDIVSREAAAAWTARLISGAESYAGRLGAYVASVSKLADRLRETAKEYGYTEEEVSNAFKSIEVKSG